MNEQIETVEVELNLEDLEQVQGGQEATATPTSGARGIIVVC